MSLTIGDVSKIMHIGMKCVPFIRNYFLGWENELELVPHTQPSARRGHALHIY